MAASYPRSVRFFLSNLSITKQIFKKRVESPNSTAGPNDTIIFPMPSTNVNADSVHVQFEFTTNPVSGKYARLSKHTESLVQTIQHESNGTMFDGGCRFTNVLMDTMHDYMVDQNKSAMRSVLQNDYTNSGVAPTTADSKHTSQPMILSTFPGFLGTCQPRILPCDLLPLRTHIRLADTKCLITNDTAATFSLANIHVVYETIAIEDGGLFDATLRDGLAQAPLEISFDLWKSFCPGQVDIDNVVQAAGNTESLDLVLGVTLDPSAISTPNAYDSVTGKSTYFKRGWGSNGALDKSWFTVQGVPYPAWQPNAAETFAQTQRGFGQLNDTVGGSAAYLNGGAGDVTADPLAAYKNSGYANLMVFAWPNGDEAKDMRLRSGMNVSGSTSGIEWISTGTTGGAGKPSKILFTKQTAVLLVGQGQQIQLRA